MKPPPNSDFRIFVHGFVASVVILKLLCFFFSNFHIDS